MPTVLFRLRPCPAAAKHHSHVKLLQPCADAKWHGAMKIQQWPLRHVGSVKLAWFCSHLYFYISKIWQLFHVPSMITITIKLQNDITSSCHITSETCNSQMTLFIYVHFLFFLDFTYMKIIICMKMSNLCFHMRYGVILLCFVSVVIITLQLQSQCNLRSAMCTNLQNTFTCVPAIHEW